MPLSKPVRPLSLSGPTSLGRHCKDGGCRPWTCVGFTPFDRVVPTGVQTYFSIQVPQPPIPSYGEIATVSSKVVSSLPRVDLTRHVESDLFGVIVSNSSVRRARSALEVRARFSHRMHHIYRRQRGKFGDFKNELFSRCCVESTHRYILHQANATLGPFVAFVVLARNGTGSKSPPLVNARAR